MGLLCFWNSYSGSAAFFMVIAKGDLPFCAAGLALKQCAFRIVHQPLKKLVICWHRRAEWSGDWRSEEDV